MACQVIAVLYRIAPACTRTNVRKVLQKLSKHKVDWEIRHGAMLAMQYLSTIDKAPDVNEEFASCSVGGLSDSSDDVKSASAKLLSCLMKNESDPPLRGAELVWDALEATRNTSFCGADLIEYFSKLVCRDCDGLFGVLSTSLSTVIDKMLEFSEAFSSVVKISTFDAIESVLKSDSVMADKNMSASLSKLITRLFESFLCLDSWVEDPKARQRLKDSRDRVWKQAVFRAGQLLSDDKSHRRELIAPLMLQFIGLKKEKESTPSLDPKRSLTMVRVISDALATLFVELGEETLCFVDVCIKILLLSPWACHFDMGTLLFSSLSQQGGQKVTAALGESCTLLNDMMNGKVNPSCTRKEASMITNGDKFIELHRTIICESIVMTEGQETTTTTTTTTATRDERDGKRGQESHMRRTC